MKLQIVIPSFYTTRHTVNYKFLLQKIAEHFNSEVEYTQNPKILTDTDVVLSYAMPHHGIPNYPIKQLVNLPPKVKLVSFLRDLQCYDNEVCKSRLRSILDRSDVIISYNYSKFNEWFPEYREKYIFFPQFFGPEKDYNGFKLNKNAILKCLVSGASNYVYPLRRYVKKHKQVVYKSTSWGRKKGYVRRKYAELLHSYFCCMTSCSIFKMVLAKHSEIPATGSLLITNDCEDLRQAGFKAGKHYISITKKNAFDVIQDCLQNPEAYNKIRKNGKRFVHRFHNERNRFELLKNVLKEGL